MVTRAAIMALVLLITVVAAHADNEAAAHAPSTGDDKPTAFTPFAQSPAMMQVLSSNDTDENSEDPDGGSLGSPQPVEKYGALDKSGAVAVGVTSGAAAFTAGYFLFSF